MQREPQIQSDPYLTAKQLAAALNVSEGTIRQWTCRKDVGIPVTYIGRLARYRLSAVSAWLESGAFMPPKRARRPRASE